MKRLLLSIAVLAGWWGAAAGVVGGWGCSGKSEKPQAEAVGTQAGTGPQPVVFQNGVVAADHTLASQAGAEVLRLGGNAVDAAVATSFALSVVRPYSCGIGGGGFMVIVLEDDPQTPDLIDPVTMAIDYRERAPAAMTKDHFESLPDGASSWSGHAVAIPGTVAGLLHALERYGTLDRATVLAPAIRIAERGFAIDEHTYDAIRELNDFLESGDTTLRGYAFLRDRYTRGGGYHEEMIVRLPRQARALRMIARDGVGAFYDGPIGDAIVGAVQRAGGVLTHLDLAGYRPTEVNPLMGEAMGRTLVTMPLPSSGGIALQQMLAMLAVRPDLLAQMEWGSPEYIHLVAEVMKHAMADRARHLGDPEFVEVDVDRLLDRSYLRARAATIQMHTTHGPEHYGIEGEFPVDGGTSHFSVVDRWGNAVACTETINLRFGSRVAVPEFGFALNNQMDDFLTRRGTVNAFGLTQSERNLPEAGKRPLSSMSPTIVLDADGRVEAVVGGSGGPRIITGTFQVTLNVLLWDMGAEEAVSAGRFHHQWQPNVLLFETVEFEGQPDRLDTTELREGLAGRGHELGERLDIAQIQLIRRARVGEGWEAASDPRKGGKPAGE